VQQAAAHLLGAVGGAIARGMVPAHVAAADPAAGSAGTAYGAPADRARGRFPAAGRSGRVGGRWAAAAGPPPSPPPPPPPTLLFDWLLPVLAGQAELPGVGRSATADEQVGLRFVSLYVSAPFG